jgi:hypothetical protein
MVIMVYISSHLQSRLTRNRVLDIGVTYLQEAQHGYRLRYVPNKTTLTILSSSFPCRIPHTGTSTRSTRCQYVVLRQEGTGQITPDEPTTKRQPRLYAIHSYFWMTKLFNGIGVRVEKPHAILLYGITLYGRHSELFRASQVLANFLRFCDSLSQQQQQQLLLSSERKAPRLRRGEGGGERRYTGTNTIPYRNVSPAPQSTTDHFFKLDILVSSYE